MHLVLWLFSSPLAHAAGGSFAGPVGEDPPPSAATQVVVAPGEEGTTLVLTAQVAADADALALLWPAPGIVPNTVAPVLPQQFARLERFTEPRVEELRCDELVDVTRWPTPPGCATYDYVRPPPKRGEDAADRIPAIPEWADTEVFHQVLEPDELAGWLDERGLALGEAMAAALQPHLDAGTPILAIAPFDPVKAGEWLPPVRFLTAPGEIVLPLTVGAAAGSTPHELHVFTVTPKQADNPSLANFPRGYVQDDCVLPEDQDGPAFVEAERERIRAEGSLPTWVLEYAGPADACAPCTDEPLTMYEVSVLGQSGKAEDVRLGRIRMDWEAGGLDQDPVLVFDGGRFDADLVLLQHEPQLAFAFPTCGEDHIDQNGEVCSNLALPEGRRGCSTSAAAPAVAVVLAALLVRRRRAWVARALVGLALLLVGGVAAAAPPDLGPKLEVAGGFSVIGTDRIVPDGLESGAPWLLNPYLAIEVRRSLLAWKTGRTVGVLGSMRGLGGRAAPWGARGVVGFTLLEPQLGIDVRHGRLREADPCWFGRYGLDVTAAVLDSSVSASQAYVSGGVHGGFGVWLGRGPARTSIELRGSTIARTDGFETQFHPAVGLPGWMFFPGAANVWLMVGRVMY